MEENKISLTPNLEDNKEEREQIKRNTIKDEVDEIKDNKGKEKKGKESDEQLLDNDKREKEIKEKIEHILKEKIKNCNYWSKEQLEQAKNIIENQTKVAIEYIYDLAQERLTKENEDKNEKYYKKLEKKSIEIAKYEAHVNPNFNMDAAIKKEQEIKEKVEKGEMTPEEALKAYSEPVSEFGGGMLNSLSKLGVKTYEDIYKEMSQKESEKSKEEKFRDSLSKDAPSLEEQFENSKSFKEKFEQVDRIRDEDNNREHE